MLNEAPARSLGLGAACGLVRGGARTRSTLLVGQEGCEKLWAAWEAVLPAPSRRLPGA